MARTVHHNVQHRGPIGGLTTMAAGLSVAAGGILNWTYANTTVAYAQPNKTYYLIAGGVLAAVGLLRLAGGPTVRMISIPGAVAASVAAAGLLVASINPVASSRMFDFGLQPFAVLGGALLALGAIFVD